MTFLEKKKEKQINKKNMWGKLKLDYQPAEYRKNKFDNDSVLKKYVGKHYNKTKTMQEKHCSNPYLK